MPTRTAAARTKTSPRTKAGAAAERSPKLLMPRDFNEKDVAVARGIPGARNTIVNLFGDPAAEAKKIFARVGDLSGFKLFGGRILVAKYEREHVGTSGALYAAVQTQVEDRYQGKIGLVIKKGTVAFVDDDRHQFHGDDVNVGDWIFFSYGDGADCDLCPPGTTDKVHCKLLMESEVHGIVPRPDSLF